MATPKLYALLVGINEYPAPVTPLYACVKDVGRMKTQLEEIAIGVDLKAHVLLNEEATRHAVIKGFREHLGKAGTGDIALFYFAGHGSRQGTAREFQKKGLNAGNIEETIICYDSRVPGGWDLADKELAVLVDELASKGASVRCIFDSCHSRSIVRKNKGEWRIRRFHSDPIAYRPLDTYLDGYFLQRGSLRVPESNAMILSACREDQTALEFNDHGLFTLCLLQAFADLGPDPSISQLHRRAKTRVQQALERSEIKQTPQLSVRGTLDPDTSFLGKTQPPSFLKKFGVRSHGSWYIEFGMLDGASVGGRVALFGQLGEFLMEGIIEEVGLLRSRISLEEELKHKWVEARIEPEPGSKLRICLCGESPLWAEIKAACLRKGSKWIAFVSADEATHQLRLSGGEIRVEEVGSGILIGGRSLSNSDIVEKVVRILYKVMRWQIGARFEGRGIRMQEIEFYFANPVNRLREKEVDLRIKISRPGEQKRILIEASNGSPENLYFTFLYFSREFDIHSSPPVLIPGGEGPVTLFGQAGSQYFFLPERYLRNRDILRLLVTRKVPEDSLIHQAGLKSEIDGIVRHIPQQAVSQDNIMITEWGLKDLTLELYRE